MTLSSSGPDPIITNFTSAFKVLTFDQIQLWKTAEVGNKSSDHISWHNRLMNGIPPIKRSDVLKKIGQWQGAKIATVVATVAKRGVQAPVSAVTIKKQLDEVLEPRTLEEVNRLMAAEHVATWPMTGINAAAMKLGVKPNASEQAKRAVVGVWIAELCNSHGVILDEWVAAYKANPNANPTDLTGQGISPAEQIPAGSGSIFSRGLKKLIRHPLKWLRRVFVTEIGKGIAKFMQNILDFTEDLGFLNQFLLKPTGLNVLLTTLREVGDALVDGSISTFDEHAVAREGAATLASAGQALMSAAPILTATGIGAIWGAAAAAVGYLSSQAAALITATLDAPIIQKQQDAFAKQKGLQATAQAENTRKVFLLMSYAARRNMLQQGFRQTPTGEVWGAEILLPNPRPNPPTVVPLAIHSNSVWTAVVLLPPNFPALEPELAAA